MQIPSVSDVEQIAALADPALRNLQITQCYYELALALVARTGLQANWCTFATWASKQAGQTIRKEDLLRTLAARLGSEAAAQQALAELLAAARRLGIRLKLEKLIELVWQAYDPAAAFERASAAVGRGNLKVFAEIGREFARFYAACLPDDHFDQASIERFVSSLRPGDPPDGQAYLRRAFTHYYQALFTDDPQTRRELLLLANLLIGFHEQTRLQPEINAALVAPLLAPEVFARNLLAALRPQGGLSSELAWRLLRLFGRLREIETAIQAVLAGAQRQVQAIVTETMMSLELPPQRRLPLGEDLTAGFAAELQRLAHPELLVLLAQIDPTPDSPAESGAVLWGDLPDRMHFIADLFRSEHLNQALFDPPFTPEQTAALKSGRLPDGRL